MLFIHLNPPEELQGHQPHSHDLDADWLEPEVRWGEHYLLYKYITITWGEHYYNVVYWNIT